MTATRVLTHFAVASRDDDGQAGRSPATVMPDSPRSRRALLGGRAISAFAVLFLLFDASVKVLQLPIAVEATTQLGYARNVLFWLGLLELACLALYLVPRTAVLGAVLWTGYLGGAVATHVRVGNPLLSQALFPVYVALLLWGGLWLCDERLRAVLPLRAPRRHNLGGAPTGA
jgi:DoxX-like family